MRDALSYFFENGVLYDAENASEIDFREYIMNNNELIVRLLVNGANWFRYFTEDTQRFML